MNSSSTITRIKRPATIALVMCVIFSLLAAPVSMASSTTPRLSYIVEGTSTDQVVSLAQKYQGLVTSRLEIINGAGVLLSPQQADWLRGVAGIREVTLNAAVHVTEDGEEGGLGKKSPATDYPDVVGANVTWQQGDIGRGVSVAVVDTGLGLHRGLTRNVNGTPFNRIIAWVDFVDHKRFPEDPNGHGTHVAGIIANSQIGADGEWNGVAPGVSLVGVRVLDKTGAGNYEQVIQGIQWVIQHKRQYNIKIMNLSLVSPAQSPYWADPLDQAAMKAWASGITVVVAAGNGGPAPMTIGVPANTPYVVTVGAFTDNYTPLDWSDDYITPFSAAGPTLDGFVKPDVVAPGAHMVSTMLPSSYIARHHEASRVTNDYFSMAGTSQAAAVVSGIAALVLSKNPGLAPDQVKYRLMYTAYPWIDLTTTDALYSMWQQGAGRVNAPDAVFGGITGQANYGMDINADIAGTQHYEGFSYYDETTGEFRLRGEYQNWTGKYGNWSGTYGNWSGGYGDWTGHYGNWSGGFTDWAGKYGNWSGGYGNWSGNYGNWSGGYGNWSGSYGNWSGGYGNWSGGYGNWSGSVPWAGSFFANKDFVTHFLAGTPPDAVNKSATIDNWVPDQ
jgi:serine protease AprX